MSYDSADLVLARIDERTRIITEKMSDIQAAVDKLNGIVLTGNGKESLVTRMRLIEDDFDRWLTQCEQCRATILRPRDENGAIVEVAKINAVEGWKFRTAVVLAAFSTISALVIAIFKP